MEKGIQKTRNNRGSLMQGKEGEESPRVSLEPTEKEEEFALTALSKPINSREKRQRKTPL